jgi:phage-related protein
MQFKQYSCRAVLGGDMIILNHAFQKKTQKTPKNAIEKAENRKKDYLDRKSKEIG